MTAFSTSACYFLWAVFLLSSIDAAPAPVADGEPAHSQALDIHNNEAGSSRCYYNFQHYEEGDRIITNEPCLNCTCHKRMLMCYLRVCPFTKPVGQDCTVEKKPDQCCPVITCPEVPVDIVTSSTTEASLSSSSAIGYASKFGCMLEDNTFYPDGVQMPSDPKKPCELCYCIRNHTACVRQECTLNVEGCRPVYQDGVCCPVRYDCDYQEISTTERPATGGLLLGTTASPSQQCRYNDIVYNDGELIETDKPCESCYCMRGDIVCAVRSCGEPMEGKNCHALPPPEGQCCPTIFQCENGTISIDSIATESSIIMNPSPMEPDVSTKGPEPQPTVGELSDDKDEEMEHKGEEIVSSTEVSPSDSQKEDENKEDKHEEEKANEYPGGHVLSEPADSDDLEDEESLASHPHEDDGESETQRPEISEHLSTSTPEMSDKEVTQSSTVSETNSSEGSAATNIEKEHSEIDQKVEDGTTGEQESTKDKLDPEPESAGTDENVIPSESTPEKEDSVTELPKQEEPSTNKHEDDVAHEELEINENESPVLGGESEQPKEPTLEQTPVPFDTNDKKEEEMPTTEENAPSAPVVGESVPSNADDTENSEGIEVDETKTEPNEIGTEDIESGVEEKPHLEKEGESSTVQDNEIKFEEIPSKTPESLDQVKDPEVSLEKVDTSASELPEASTNDDSTSSTVDEEGNSQEKEEVETKPETASVDSGESAAPPEVLGSEHIGHFHKEQPPPRKNDASEEIEQRPQHPEGSMTKADDSIPDEGQPQTEVSATDLPINVDKPEEAHEQNPSDIENKPVNESGSSNTRDGVDENVNNEDVHEGDVQFTEVPQTDLPITNKPSSEQHSEMEINSASEVPESPGTGSGAIVSVSENIDIATVESVPSENPSTGEESVPTVVVMEPESETSTDSLPEESIHGEVKPEVVPTQDDIHDPGSGYENEHQSLQTEQPIETEKGTAEQFENEKQPEGVESENFPPETTQSSPTINVVEDSLQEEKTPSSDEKDNTFSSEKGPDNIAEDAVTSEVPHETDGKDTVKEPAPSEIENESSPTSETSTSGNEESSGETHSVTTENGEESVNEIKPNDKHDDEKPTAPPTAEATDTLIKTSNEVNPDETEDENKEESVTESNPLETTATESKPAESTITETKPLEIAENPTPESELPAEEIHHDPVESEPTEFDDNDFEDHDSTSDNEIVDDHLSGHGGAIGHEIPSAVPGPVGVIPGEGDCLVDGQTYTNNSVIPSKSPCHKQCTCISSIVHCQGIDCPAPPPELANCMPVHQSDMCCPVYTCDENTPAAPPVKNVIKESEDHSTPLGSEPSESDVMEESEQVITSTEKIEPSDNTNNKSGTENEIKDPVKVEETSFQSSDSVASVEDHPVSSDQRNPETPEPTAAGVNEQDITPSTETTVEEHNENLGDEQSVENVTAKLDSTEEDLKTKPDTEAGSSGDVPGEVEKGTQHTGLTDQSEKHGTDTQESKPTEEIGSEESSSQSNDEHTVSNDNNLSEAVENEQAKEPEVPGTETPQAGIVGETNKSDGQEEEDNGNRQTQESEAPGTEIPQVEVAGDAQETQEQETNEDGQSHEPEAPGTETPQAGVEGEEQDNEGEKVEVSGNENPQETEVPVTEITQVGIEGEKHAIKGQNEGASENEHPQEPEATGTEISQSGGESDAQETEGQKEEVSSNGQTQEPEVTGTETPQEGVTGETQENEGLKEKLNGNEQSQEPEAAGTEPTQTGIAGDIQETEGQKDVEVALDNKGETETQVSSENADEHTFTVTQIPSEEKQPDKEPDSPSSELAPEHPEDTQNASEEAHVSDDVNTETNVNTETITNSQDKNNINQVNDVTQDQSESEISVTDQPVVDESSQNGQENESEGASQSGVEGMSEPATDAKPQSPEDGQKSEDSATETASTTTESSLVDDKLTSEGEVSPTDTKDESVPSEVSEKEVGSEQNPLDKHNTEEVKPDNEQKVNDDNIEAATSQSVVSAESEENQESEPEGVTAASHPEEQDTKPHVVPAPEGAVHDGLDEIEGQNEEKTESTLEGQHEPSTQAPSFDGPSTKGPSTMDEHGEEISPEGTKGPEYEETPIEAVEAPQPDNLLIDSTGAPASSQQEEIHGQTPDTGLENQEIMPDSDKHGSGSQDISKPGSQTNEIQEHISELPNENVEHQAHDTEPQVTQDDKEESSHQAGDHEESVTDTHSEEGISHSTEIPTEESANENKVPVHAGGESNDTEEEFTTEHVELEAAQEETEPAEKGPEPIHESEPAQEKPTSPIEEAESASEDSGQVHEDSEPGQDHPETTLEGSEPAHEEPGTSHDENEPTQEESEPAHEDDEKPNVEPDHVHEEPETFQEDSEATEGTEQTHHENESSNGEETEHHEETESANAVSVGGESDHDHQIVTSVNEAEQSTSESSLSENVPEETGHVEDHQTVETDHSAVESDHSAVESDHSAVESEHSGSDSESDHQTHETEHPDENTIEEAEQPTHELEQGAHKPDLTQDAGSIPPTHAIDHSTQHGKPEEPELPPEDQFTPDDMDYDVSEDGAFGPGTCRYGGKVYVSAQQIPRDDPCDFCFCFRSDIICLQQSCPPPIHRCHQEPIQGYCCPRYQCPVSMATSLNITTTTSTTTTTLPPHFFAHAYHGAARQSGCFHRGRAYEVGEEIVSASGPCLQCICGSDGQMRCDPKVCNPEPMVRKLMEAAVSHRRR